MEAVGRIAGVSQVTVSRALSDPAKVSAETLARIREAIEVTGFVPNAIAGALASRKSMLISALVPSITNVIYTRMIRTFSERMRGHGYEIMLSETGFTPEDEEKVVALHLSRQPDAMMLTGIHHSAGARRALLAAGVPVVELWDITETPIDLCVGFSHAQTGRAVADFALGAGHARLAMIHAGDERALRRMRAFAERIEQKTGRAPEEINLDAPASFGRGRLGLSRLLEETDFGRGLIHCSSDLLAHGVIAEARARGIRVPEEIAVVGFADQEFAADVDPGITTVRVDCDLLGARAAEALLARIAGETPERTVYDLGFELLRRGSA
ncbi:LacI family DNA-binding transcriptional regulator [Pseudooceanicola nanhaiensis]|uniref:LacI family DNA-binding transcriptional regulator n=1 Tax=Pseudooceanicola nanhaiensis TaxID=375761 RepID=UPI0040593229